MHRSWRNLKIPVIANQKLPVVASQFANWRGNPPNIAYNRGILTSGFALLRMTDDFGVAISSPLCAQCKDLLFRANECESRNLRISLTFAIKSVPGSLDSLRSLGMTVYSCCVDFYSSGDGRWRGDMPQLLPTKGAPNSLVILRRGDPDVRIPWFRRSIRGIATPVTSVTGSQ